MENKTPESGQEAARALHSLLSHANDAKIRRVTEMLDGVPDVKARQTIMEPLRPRLKLLKIPHQLRLERLLFIPFEPLIVPAREWRPGDATIPRTILTAIAGVVRAGLGPDAAAIDAMVAGHRTDEIQVVTLAGEALWPRASAILAGSAEAPSDWAKTGVRETLYQPLARIVAAVLCRAPRLRSLLRDADVAVLNARDGTIAEILRTIADEPAEACAMVVQLILLQSPGAAPLLRRFIAANANSAQKALLSAALAQGTEEALAQLDGPTGIAEVIGSAPLGDIGDHVRRIATLLREVGLDTAASAHRPHLKAIRRKLDAACRARFADGMSSGLVQPLTPGSGAVDQAGQIRMETCIRDLRKLETEVRTAGGASGYDDLLVEASDTVHAAAAAGTLTPVRTCRLIELLSGPEAALALYRKEA
jgi:hypothetical protein